MTNQDREDRQRFIDIIRVESEPSGLDYTTRTKHAEKLLRLAKTHGKLQEFQCNGVGTVYGESNESFGKRQDKFEKWVEKREKDTERRISEIASALGLPVTFSGDPRGYTVRFMLPSKRFNSWGGEESGYGVPTVE
jgi:hypothetical protein